MATKFRQQYNDFGDLSKGRSSAAKGRSMDPSELRVPNRNEGFGFRVQVPGGSNTKIHVACLVATECV